jgi:acetolactate synthase I/II/III large subunit
MKMRVADVVAAYFVEKGIKDLFFVSGAGNVHLLESIGRRPELSYVCPHHEQAGVMAAIAYYRTCGRLSPMLTTSGGSASNAVTGALDAWADSIPVLIISGQEKSTYARRDNQLRMWGIQGFDIAKMVEGITKYSAIVDDPLSIRFHLDKAYDLALSGRPGPVWLDIPADVQAATIETDDLKTYVREPQKKVDLTAVVKEVLTALGKSKRPVILLGNGVRLSGAQGLVDDLLKVFQVPYLTAWNGADLIPTDHPLHFGHEGNYGQRCANFVVQNCDLLISIGSRLAIPQIGYEWSEFARGARKIIVDIDPKELAKFQKGEDLLVIEADAREFIQSILGGNREQKLEAPREWLERCSGWKAKYPIVDETIHPHSEKYVNSYEFVQQLSRKFSDDELIITDMGTALTCTHQAIALRKRNRLITSTGLGEMGYGLPGAVGASVASGKKRVILITGDGSMMMNLQELQTIRHHHLPIKVFIFINDGYLSIRHTQTGLFRNSYVGSGSASGVTCPDFAEVGKAFGFKTFRISRPAETDEVIDNVLASDGPVMCEVAMDPVQPLVPKLSFELTEDGKMVSPPLEDLSPLLDGKELAEQMLTGMHPKSASIRKKKSDSPTSGGMQ